MKHITLLCLLVLSLTNVTAQSSIELPIQEVTVFLQGAQVVRSGDVNIKQGEQEIVIEQLSPRIDKKSISVSTDGDFTILGVNHRYNFLNERKRSAKLDSLRAAIESIDLEVMRLSQRMQVLEQKRDLLSANRSLKSSDTSINLDNLKAALDFFDEQLSIISEEEMELDLRITDLKEEKFAIEKQISDTSGLEDLPYSEIVVKVNSDNRATANINLSYVVSDAGWAPSYDIRVSSIEEPLLLTYKAQVHQNTGVDWEKVKLKFSNAIPTQTGLAPELSTWRLNYARNTVYARPSASTGVLSGIVADEYGEPLIGANIVVTGTTIGTVTDFDGRFALTLPDGAATVTISYTGYESIVKPISSDFMAVEMNEGVMLNEVVVTALSGRAAGISTSKPKERNVVRTTAVENPTTVEFEIETPYSIESNGEITVIDMSVNEIDATYSYEAVPKMDPDAFLTASITDWGQYNLMQGEANLYFEGAYVGRSILDARSFVDTLGISLGRDKSIAIQRKKLDEYTRRKAIGSNVTESRAFQINVRNNKSVPVSIEVIDQIPVAAISNISVELDDSTDGVLNEETGIVIWDLTIPPGQQRDLRIAYQVKYPKKERVIIE